ncbi:hypothetical protein E2C01_042197 [Portunus trituberculatus]|uniref:Uncharacterized protein n=1 Tax=Portunus trituberculatus TaxID=210409 RepID=A0A5B7FSZ4_PORTR|nr:hypothetical protein [Portunus trituberculatus]
MMPAMRLRTNKGSPPRPPQPPCRKETRGGGGEGGGWGRSCDDDVTTPLFYADGCPLIHASNTTITVT